jgi:hypothetical protein
VAIPCGGEAPSRIAPGTRGWCAGKVARRLGPLWPEVVRSCPYYGTSASQLSAPLWPTCEVVNRVLLRLPTPEVRVT